MISALRWPFLALLVVLPAGCVATRPAAPVAAQATGGMCRLGPHGTRPDAVVQAGPAVPVDQGIGGTGHPLRRYADGVLDQGIGGTGISAVARPGGPLRPLGVVGVITGFGSVCVDNLEIAYDSATPVRLDGEPAADTALRAGQVVVLETDRAPALHAASISVRHEVSGLVESLTPDTAVIAGQRVRLSPTVWGVEDLRRGAWVEVSGLRDAEGDILATRVDPGPPSRVELRGRLVRGAVTRIDGVAVRSSRVLRSMTDKGDVDVVGRYVDGSVVAEHITPDLLAADPVAYFGPGVSDYVLEAYATPFSGGLRLGGGLVAQLAGAAPAPGSSRRVVELMRNGSTRQLMAVGVNDVALPGAPGSSAPAAGHARDGSSPQSGRAPGGLPGSSAAGASPEAASMGGTTMPFTPAPVGSGSAPGGQAGSGSGETVSRNGGFQGGMFPGGVPGGLGGRGPGGGGGTPGK